MSQEPNQIYFGVVIFVVIMKSKQVEWAWVLVLVSIPKSWIAVKTHFSLFVTGNLSYSLLLTHVWLVFSDMLPCKTTSQKISVHLFAALVKVCHDEEYGMDRVML